MNAEAILRELKPLGREGYKKVILKHGVREPCLGVKVEDLKRVRKRVGTDYRLALELYDTGVYDAMYLAGLVADDAKMTERDLEHWAAKAYGPISTATVPWVTAGSPHGMKLALAGIVLGVIASLALTRVMTNLLFGITATDLPTFLAVPAMLTIVALVANYIPARRATRLNPVIALRYE